MKRPGHPKQDKIRILLQASGLNYSVEQVDRAINILGINESYSAYKKGDLSEFIKLCKYLIK